MDPFTDDNAFQDDNTAVKLPPVSPNRRGTTGSMGVKRKISADLLQSPRIDDKDIHHPPVRFPLANSDHGARNSESSREVIEGAKDNRLTSPSKNIS